MVRRSVSRGVSIGMKSGTREELGAMVCCDMSVMAIAFVAHFRFRCNSIRDSTWSPKQRGAATPQLSRHVCMCVNVLCVYAMYVFVKCVCVCACYSAHLEMFRMRRLVACPLFWHSHRIASRKKLRKQPRQQATCNGGRQAGWAGGVAGSDAQH